MPLGRPLYEQTRDTRIADHEYWIQRLKRRTTEIGAPTPGVTVESLFLDSTASATVFSSMTLEDGANYRITVQGTFTEWNQALTVGTPEPDAMFPGSTSGRLSLEVGIDAECCFASPTPIGGTHFVVGDHHAFFQMDLGSGLTHIEPEDGAHATPSPAHAYSYHVTGQGSPIGFLINILPTSDNYGKLKITIQALDATTGGGTGSGSGTGTLVPPPGDEGSFLRVESGVAAWQDNIVEADLDLTDVTTENVTTGRHGFVPKAPNDTTKALVGDGTWAYPTVDGGTA